MDSSDIHFMKAAIREARKGVGRTSPNPTVGAVVVRNGKIVGKGYHHRAGLPHAEPNALQEAGRLARGAILYVTLEPCNHSGRTPPCTQAILQAGIKRVVIGTADPNPSVTGNGAAFLSSHGIEVVSGVLAAPCRELNLSFIKYSTTGLPWVIMKAGMSLDGRIAAAAKRRTAITGDQSWRLVHRLRDQVDALLIGAETAIIDDPLLTTRRLKSRQGRDPQRIILDTNLRLSPNARMLHQESRAKTLIFCGPNAPEVKVQVIEESGAIVQRIGLDMNGMLDLSAVLAELGRRQITSILVEGGGRVHGAFLRNHLVDQVYLFIAPVFLGSGGVPAVGLPFNQHDEQIVRLRKFRTRRLGEDLLVEGRFDSAVS
jgi:diaminohydroxyphosphoribosylaminopyrimidine deaminase/5-amino-6-(5-phosphoribosylamino)uracil reductase